MKIIEDIEEFCHKLSRPVVTVGTFDGVHRGHMSVLSTVQTRAQELKRESIALSFEPHPQTVLNPKTASPILTTKEEKLEIIEKIGIHTFVILSFTRDFSLLSPKDFVERILLSRLGVGRFIIGHDHGFGRGRSGDIDMLEQLGQELGFEVEVVPPQIVDGDRISSTRIRKLISSGNMRLAANFLGRNYSFSGEVVKGESRGKQLGFPTANIRIGDPWKLIPPDGVYAVWTEVSGRRYKGVMNVGYRPSFGGKEHVVEVHIIGFESDLYGRTLKVEVLEKIRDEMKFGSADQLAKQIEKDKEKGEEILNVDQWRGRDFLSTD